MIVVRYHSTRGYKRIVISRDVISDELRDWQHVVTDESKGCNNAGIVHATFEREETAVDEVHVK